MRVLSLHLQDFRGVADRCVPFAPAGVTVVEGDNEVGKTSMLDALDLLFDVPDSSAKASVRATQPVGRDVATVVEAEVLAGHHRFTYRKQFHRQTSTRLTIHEPVLEQLGGRDAHERVQSILAQEVDLPLWRALRLQQGVRLDQADLDVQSSLARALDASVAETVGGHREETLVSRARAERDQYLTPGGKTREEGLRLRRLAGEAVAAVEGLRAAVADVERTVQQLDRTRLDLGRARQTAAEDAVVLHELEERVAAGAELARTAESLVAAARESRTSQQLARERLVSRAELVARVDELRGEAADAEQELERARTARSERSTEEDDAVRAVAEVDARVVAAGSEQRRLAAELTQLREAAELHRLSALVERHDAARAEVERTEQSVLASTVTDDVLAEVEARHRDWRTTDEVARAAAPVLVLTGAGRTVETETGRVVLGEEPFEVRLTPGAWLSVDGVRVEGRAGPAQLDASRQEQQARAALAESCARAGVTDLEDAVRGAHRRRAQESVRDRALQALAAAAEDADLEAVRRRLGVLLGRQLEHRTLGETARGAEEVEALAAAADVEQAEAMAARTVCEARLGAARSLFEAARGVEVRAGTAAGSSRTRLGLVEGDLASARADVDDAGTEQLADDAGARASRAEEEADAAARRLGASGHEQARAERDHLRRVVADGEVRRRQLEAEVARLATVLEERGAAGLTEQMDRALTAAGSSEEQASAWERRAAAATTLFEALERARSTAQLAYVEPLRRQVQDLAEKVFGADVVVTLGPDLRITHRTLAGSTVPFDQLSTGAREQLAVLGRLACAMLVSGGAGVPVLIDDALGHSDPVRLRGMGRALEAAGEHCQVVVLTCYPDRYRWVTGATTVTLGPDLS